MMPVAHDVLRNSGGTNKNTGHHSAKDTSTVLRMNKLLFVATLSTLTALGFSQDPGVKADVETKESLGAKRQAEAFIKEKGWSRGKNPDGSFVAINVSSYSGKTKNLALARSNAFQMACLKAKQDLATYLSTEISTEVGANLKRGEAANSPIAEDGSASGPVKKLATDAVQTLLAASKQASKDLGILPEQILLSTDFKSAVQTAARAEVCGVAVSGVYESKGAAGDGSLAIVVRYTNTSKELANAALGRGSVPVNERLAEAQAWVDENEKELFKNFGTKIFRDKNNQVCVVAFGQADIKGKSETAIEIATEIAKTAAQGELRMFVGELVTGENLLKRGTSFKELEIKGFEFNDAENYNKNMSAKAERLKFQGISVIKEWDLPSEGANGVAGAVLVWSQGGADAANALRAQMESVGGSKGGDGRQNVPPPAESSPNRPKMKLGGAAPTAPEP
jgi:hypothetical protein